MSRYTVGVAGCGSIATERHIPAIQTNDATELVSVYDHKYPNAERAASKFDIKNAFDDYEAFLDTVDIVTIATPPVVHAEQSITALESGTHVLCEKPMAVEKEDAERMVHADREQEARLGLVHNFLFSHSMRKAKRLVNRGEIGDVQYIKGFQVSSPSRGLPSWYTELPYDLFFDEAPHLLYLMEHFIGQPKPRHVEPQFDDNQLQSLTATLVGEDDRMGQLTMHFNAPFSEWYLFIIGTQEILIVDIFRDILYQFGHETSHSAKEVLMMSISAIYQITNGVIKSGVRLLQNDLYFGFNDLLNRYIRAIQHGTDLPISAEDGHRILNSAYDIIEFKKQ
jgi:predicted dehydrogenase